MTSTVVLLFCLDIRINMQLFLGAGMKKSYFSHFVVPSAPSVVRSQGFLL